MIKKILSFKTPEGEDLSSETKLWIVGAIAGVVIVDKNVHSNEKIHIEVLFEEVKENPQALITMHEIIKQENPPKVRPISLPPKLAENILKYLLEIASCDYEMPPEEIRYINEVGMALNINVVKVHKLIHFAIRRVKIEFFNQLLSRLNPIQRRWLAFVVLKAIYLDGQIDKREIVYLNDVYELLEGNKKLLHTAKNEAKDENIDHLPEVSFEKETVTLIMKYLLGVTMSNTSVAHEEVGFVRKIATVLNYDQDELEVHITSEYKTLLFLTLSGRI